MASHPLLVDLVDWPERWMRDDPDLATGREILRALEPFLAALAASSLSRRTLRRHIDNTFLLGGQIIDEVNWGEDLRALDGVQLVLQFVDEEGGPFCKYISGKDDQRSYDATCRQLYRFLKARSAGADESGERKKAKRGRRRV
jgi:hypothetical protein